LGGDRLVSGGKKNRKKRSSKVAQEVLRSKIRKPSECAQKKEERRGGLQTKEDLETTGGREDSSITKSGEERKKLRPQGSPDGERLRVSKKIRRIYKETPKKPMREKLKNRPMLKRSRFG